jgi:uncharacterized protein (TIGR04255 family)
MEQNPKLRSLPRRQRVIYGRNPLAEVVAAIRFPPILALVQEPPSEFQRAFAIEYPLSEVTQSLGAVFVGGVPHEGLQNQPLTQRGYRFRSQDSAWRVDLEPSLLALSCYNYPEWAQFRDRFKAIIEGLSSIYRIQLITRLGLRYKDVISKGPLGLSGRPWRDLIKPEVFGTMAFFTDDMEANPQTNFSIVLEIPPGQVRIGITAVKNPEGEAGILIDTDCFAEENCALSIDDVMSRANELHEYTSIVFQACITDVLHDALLGNSKS